LYGAALGSIIFFLVIPSIFYGIDRNIKFLTDFSALVILPFFKNNAIIRETVYFTHSNQSLDAFIIRHFSDFGRINYPQYGIHNFIDPVIFTQAGAKLASTIIKIILLIACGFAFSGGKKKNQRLLKFEYAIMFLLILFVSPSSWINHYISVIFAYYVAASYIAGENKPSNKIILMISLVSAVIITCTGVNPFMQSFSGIFLGHFILFAGLMVVFFREKYNIP
jgi:hypothetical protein